MVAMAAAWGMWASSTITANTMEASPRGPNQPMNATGGRSGVGAQQCEGNGQHSYDGQAEDRVDHDLPGHLLECWAEQHRPEGQEGHAVQRHTCLFGEVHGLFYMVLGQQAEGGPGDERGDEA